MSLRIIAGERRGALLKTPPGASTRPTLGRVKTSLFMILAPWLTGARVLDVFAGSGALGLEALSRGARQACFLESNVAALTALRENILKLRWTDRTSVICSDALAILDRQIPPGQQPFDIIFLDPPYGQDFCIKTLEKLAAGCGGWLAAGGIVVAQVGRKDPLPEACGCLERIRVENYSETRVDFYQIAINPA